MHTCIASRLTERVPFPSVYFGYAYYRVPYLVSCRGMAISWLLGTLLSVPPVVVIYSQPILLCQPDLKFLKLAFTEFRLD